MFNTVAMRSAAPLFKTLLFTIVVPGTVGVLVPRTLAATSVRVAWDLWGISSGVLILLGVLIYLRTALDFALRGRGTPAPIDPPKQLIVSGPNRFVRNPMYIAVLSVVFGQALLYRSRPVAMYALVLWLSFHLWVLFYEEPHLRRLFGPEYARYCASIHRWIPTRRPYAQD